MSVAVLNKFTQTEGIAVACTGQYRTLIFGYSAGTSEEDQQRWEKVFTTAQELLVLLGPEETELKISLGAETLILRENNGTYLGVIAAKGHPVVKSLQRMIRRGFKRLGAPIMKSARSPSVHSGGSGPGGPSRPF